MTDPVATFHTEVTTRLARLAAEAASGPIAEAADLMSDCLANGGVIHAFGTGHSEAFAMEIAGRAGGLIPTSKLALRDVVLHGSHEVSELSGATLERDDTVADELFAIHPKDPRDIFLIASNSGVNGSVVGLALAVKNAGHGLIGLTSFEHTAAVTPKHPSGKRLRDIADVTIDNLAPFGDVTLTLDSGLKAGAVSSITSAFIAQLLTMLVAEHLSTRGLTPPLYISANIPGGDEHNDALLKAYEGRLRIQA